jgi:hypothetical protein
MGHRPWGNEPDTAGNAEVVRVVRATAGTFRGAHPLLITTAPWPAEQGEPPARARQADVVILDRPMLDRLLRDRASAHRLSVAKSDAEIERRARAAERARAYILSQVDAVRTDMARTGLDETGAENPDSASLPERARTARQALLALETVLNEWESGFGSAPSRDETLAIMLEPAAFDTLSARAEHLFRALRVAASALGGASISGERAHGAWLEAVREEVLACCDALSHRCTALDPLAWRTFTAAHHSEHAELSVTARERSRRAGVRARQHLNAPRARGRVAVARRARDDGAPRS